MTAVRWFHDRCELRVTSDWDELLQLQIWANYIHTTRIILRRQSYTGCTQRVFVVANNNICCSCCNRHGIFCRWLLAIPELRLTCPCRQLNQSVPLPTYVFLCFRLDPLHHPSLVCFAIRQFVLADEASVNCRNMSADITVWRWQTSADCGLMQVPSHRARSRARVCVTAYTCNVEWQTQLKYILPWNISIIPQWYVDTSNWKWSLNSHGIVTYSDN